MARYAPATLSSDAIRSASRAHTRQAIDSADDNDTNSGQFIAEWRTDGGNDRARFIRGEVDNNYDAQVSYAVVEFTGDAWSVEREEFTFTLSTGTMGTVDIDPPIDPSLTFLVRKGVNGYIRLFLDHLFNGGICRIEKVPAKEP